MARISRFIPSPELGQYEQLFSSPVFTEMLKDFNLGESTDTEIVKIKELNEDGTVTITNKLLDFGKKAQVVLTHYEADTNHGLDVGDAAELWVKDGEQVVFLEYVNGMLQSEAVVDEVHDVFKDYLKIPEVEEQFEDQLAGIMYDPASCISTGSCCFFENQRYEHCGMTCGRYNNAGGGTPINAIDRCCRTHDTQLQGSNPIPRCRAHQNLINCMDPLSGPGDTTIRTGIRLDGLWNGCGWITAD